MKNLIIKWTISKAQDSYGYNVVTLYDNDKKYRTIGGGYDMLGTVFAKWLWFNYKQTIIDAIKHKKSDYYGFNETKEGHYYIDGACGLDCMIRIANAIGLKVARLYDKRKIETTNFIITE